VVCLSSLGPVPFAVMLLGDLGARVTRVDRPGRTGSLTGLPLEDDPRTRGHRGIGIDLRSSSGRAVLLRLAEHADVFLEGMRPGAAEKLGIGPEELLGVNPGLVYGRATGWGQAGPRAVQAGHDINYAGVAGGVFPLGPADAPPLPPLNLLADFGGGGAYLALGVLAALHQRRLTGSPPACGPTAGVRTCSTARRTFTAPTARRTAASWPWAPWSRGSTAS
jgi:alpha-methylacyl-CoA racemase